MNCLRTKRLAKGLTALALGKRAGIPEMRVYHLERGRFRPRRDEAERLAKALGTSIEALALEVRS